MLSKFITLDFLSPYLGSALRHLLTLISGALISSGTISQAQGSTWVDATLPIVVGGVFYFWSQIGSWINKAK